MTCHADTMPAGSIPAQASAPAHGLTDAVKRLWTAYWTRKAQRTTVRMLEGLDDKTLRDIGLGRSEIESVVYGGSGERRLHYRTRWE